MSNESHLFKLGRYQIKSFGSNSSFMSEHVGSHLVRNAKFYHFQKVISNKAHNAHKAQLAIFPT